MKRVFVKVLFKSGLIRIENKTLRQFAGSRPRVSLISISSNRLADVDLICSCRYDVYSCFPNNTNTDCITVQAFFGGNTAYNKPSKNSKSCLIMRTVSGFMKETRLIPRTHNALCSGCKLQFFERKASKNAGRGRWRERTKTNGEEARMNKRELLSRAEYVFSPFS